MEEITKEEFTSDKLKEITEKQRFLTLEQVMSKMLGYANKGKFHYETKDFNIDGKTRDELRARGFEVKQTIRTYSTELFISWE